MPVRFRPVLGNYVIDGGGLVGAGLQNLDPEGSIPSTSTIYWRKIMPADIDTVNQLLGMLDEQDKSMLPEIPLCPNEYSLYGEAVRNLLFEYTNQEEEITSLREKIDELEQIMEPVSPDLGDLSDLPDELFEELSIVKPDELTRRLFIAVKSYEEKATLDQIIVALYRKFGEIYERRLVQNKLYRAQGIYQVKDEKGMFTTDAAVARGLDDYELI